MRDNSYSRCPTCQKIYPSYRGAIDTDCLTCWSRKNPSVYIAFPKGVLDAAPPEEKADRHE